MSFYTAVFGQNQAADAILATLGLTREDVGRFRDCFVTEGEIAVYTRNGGNNRECCCSDGPACGAECRNPDTAQCACTGCVITHRLPSHPLYVRDEDDDFDSTYATIYFRFPDEHADQLRLLEAREPFDPSARWLKAIEDLRVWGFPK